MPVRTLHNPYKVLFGINSVNIASFQEVTRLYLRQELSADEAIQRIGLTQLKEYSKFLLSIFDLRHMESVKILRERITSSFSSKKLPPEIWGYIGSKAQIQEVLTLRQVSKQFSGVEFSRVAFQGRENERVNGVLRKLILQKRPLRNPLFDTLAPTVTKLDLSDLRLTIEIISELARKFPHNNSLTLREVPNVPELISHLSKFEHLHTVDLSTLNSDASKRFLPIREHLKLLPPTLTDLNLRWRKLEDKDLIDLAHLTALQNLNISGNQAITGKTFDLLSSTIVDLACSCTSITDAAITQLSRLINLKSLGIRECKGVTGSTLQHLPSSLQSLNCSNTSVTDAGLVQLSRLQRLEEVEVSSDAITGSTLQHLPSSLRKLGCLEASITDEAIAQLSHLHNLEELDVTCSSVKGRTFHLLSTSLRKLKCQASSFASNACARLSHLIHLQSLDLFNCTRFNGCTLQSLPISLISLFCSQTAITDAAIAQLSHLLNLQDLHFSYCNKVTGSTFHRLPPSIISLDCSFTPITDAAIAQLTHLHNLQNVRVAGCKFITQGALQHLPLAAKALHY